MEYRSGERLFEGEAKAMEILWQFGPMPAKRAAQIAAEQIGWNKNTTYTVLKKLEAKGFLRRDEPNFMCTPLVSRGEAQRAEADSLLKRFFGFSQFKRSALPNGPKVSAGGSLSPRGDWRLPSDASPALWLEEL